MILEAINIGRRGTVLRVMSYNGKPPKVGGFFWRKMLGCDFGYQININTPRRRCFISRKIKQSGKKWNSGDSVNIKYDGNSVEVL